MFYAPDWGSVSPLEEGVGEEMGVVRAGAMTSLDLEWGVGGHVCVYFLGVGESPAPPPQQVLEDNNSEELEQSIPTALSFR